MRVWFNNKGWAASVAYMNALNNVILRAGVKDIGELVGLQLTRTTMLSETPGELVLETLEN